LAVRCTVRLLVFFVLIVALLLIHDLGLELIRVYSHSLGDIERFIYTNKLLGQLEHVVSQTDNQELAVPCSLLDIVSNNGHILVV
jgi:alpha-N-acetylglucosamine transferase